MDNNNLPQPGFEQQTMSNGTTDRNQSDTIQNLLPLEISPKSDITNSDKIESNLLVEIDLMGDSKPIKPSESPAPSDKTSWAEALPEAGKVLKDLSSLESHFTDNAAPKHDSSWEAPQQPEFENVLDIDQLEQFAPSKLAGILKPATGDSIQKVLLDSPVTMVIKDTCEDVASQATALVEDATTPPRKALFEPDLPLVDPPDSTVDTLLDNLEKRLSSGSAGDLETPPKKPLRVSFERTATPTEDDDHQYRSTIYVESPATEISVDPFLIPAKESSPTLEKSTAELYIGGTETPLSDNQDQEASSQPPKRRVSLEIPLSPTSKFESAIEDEVSQQKVSITEMLSNLAASGLIATESDADKTEEDKSALCEDQDVLDLGSFSDAKSVQDAAATDMDPRSPTNVNFKEIPLVYSEEAQAEEERPVVQVPEYAKDESVKGSPQPQSAAAFTKSDEHVTVTQRATEPVKQAKARREDDFPVDSTPTVRLQPPLKQRVSSFCRCQ